MHLPMIDNRRQVRLWDESWECIADERIADDEKPIDLIGRLMGDRPEIHATIDHPPRLGSWRTRWSGLVYRSDGQLKTIDQKDILRFLTWPETPL